MIIRSHTSPFLSSRMYIIEEHSHAIVIDPFEIDAELLGGVTVDKALLTHEHFDHISGVNFFREVFHSDILCSVECAKRLEDPRKNMSAYFDVFTGIPEFENYSAESTPVEPYSCKADIIIEEGEPICWRGHEIWLISSPGHTIASACYLLDDMYLFSGDTLFASVETNTRFPSGNKKSFMTSAGKLLKLSPDIRVFPGHFEDFVLGKRTDYLRRAAEDKQWEE